MTERDAAFCAWRRRRQGRLLSYALAVLIEGYCDKDGPIDLGRETVQEFKMMRKDSSQLCIKDDEG